MKNNRFQLDLERNLESRSNKKGIEGHKPFSTKARQNVQTHQMHLPVDKKKCSGKRTDLSTEKILVIGDPTVWFKR